MIELVFPLNPVCTLQTTWQLPSLILEAMEASQFQHTGHQAGKIQLYDLRRFAWPCQGWQPIGGFGWWQLGHLGSHTQGFTWVAGVPDLTRKLQTGTMAIECLIWLSGTQGAYERPKDWEGLVGRPTKHLCHPAPQGATLIIVEGEPWWHGGRVAPSWWYHGVSVCPPITMLISLESTDAKEVKTFLSLLEA